MSSQSPGSGNPDRGARMLQCLHKGPKRIGLAHMSKRSRCTTTIMKEYDLVALVLVQDTHKLINGPWIAQLPKCLGGGFADGNACVLQGLAQRLDGSAIFDLYQGQSCLPAQLRVGVVQRLDQDRDYTFAKPGSQARIVPNGCTTFSNPCPNLHDAKESLNKDVVEGQPLEQYDVPTPG
jgi:hypothetical protein